MKSKFLFLVAGVYLLTRLISLPSNPPSLYWDEASIAYNAYSLLTTGRDEWGKLFPLEFRAFGEYKLPAYIYLTVLMESLVGLNAWAVRLPSVIFGLGSVMIVYILTRKLTGNEILSLFSAAHLTLSPSFLIFTRAGYEAVGGLFFYLLGVLCTLEFTKRRWLIVVSAVCFVLTMYFYNAFRIITPLTLIVFTIFLSKEALKNIKKLILPALLSVVIIGAGIIPFYNSWKSGSGTTRLDEVGILSSFTKKSPLIQQVALNYLSHFNPYYLFISGDINLRSQQGDYGQFYIFDLPLVLLGFYSIFKFKKRMLFIPLALVLVGPFPASIARESPHALRSISIIPFWSIIVSFGAWQVLRIIKNRSVLLLSLMLYLVLPMIYLIRFFLIYPSESAKDWQYSYKTVFGEYSNRFQNFDTIVISDHYNQPYIFALINLKYPPEKYRSQVVLNTTIRKETSVARAFDRFLFTNVDYYQLPSGRNLIFAHPSERMDELIPKEVLRFPGGEVMFYLYEYHR